MVQHQEPASALALCELYHPVRHGASAASDPSLPGHFMCIDEIAPEDFLRGVPLPPLGSLPGSPHPQVRAYRAVARHPRLFGIQIVRVHELNGGETVAVIRTGGLRRLQRRVRALLDGH